MKASLKLRLLRFFAGSSYSSLPMFPCLLWISVHSATWLWQGEDLVCFGAFLVISDLWYTLHTHTYVSVQRDRCPVVQVAPSLPGCWNRSAHTTLHGWLNWAYAACHTLVRQFIHVLDLLPRLLHRLPLAQTTQDFLGFVSTFQDTSESNP